LALPHPGNTEQWFRPSPGTEKGEKKKKKFTVMESALVAEGENARTGAEDFA